MGRVLKGARVGSDAYQVQAPAPPPRPLAIAAENAAAIAYVEDGDSPPAELCIDLDAVRAQAAKMVDDAAVQAHQTVTRAQQRALRVVEQAERGVAEIEINARTIGYEQGIADGRAAAQAEMDDMLETMRGLVEMARVERHKIIESAEPEIVRLAVAVAERILSAHVAQDPAAVLDMVRSAITRLVNRETVTVRVNPADLETMRRHRENLMSMNDIDNLRVIEDQRVDRGGVVMDTEAGTIDAKVSTQLREVRRLLAVAPEAS